MKKIRIKQQEPDCSVQVRIESTASLIELADQMREASGKQIRQLRRLVDIYRKADKLRTEQDDLDCLIDKLRQLSPKEYKQAFALCKTLQASDGSMEKAVNLETEMREYRHRMAGGIRD